MLSMNKTITKISVSVRLKLAEWQSGHVLFLSCYSLQKLLCGTYYAPVLAQVSLQVY